MIKMRHLLCFFVFLCIAGAVVVCFVPKKEFGDVYLEYSLNADKTGYTVVGSNITDQSAPDEQETVEVVISPTYKGLPVTGITVFAFRNCAMLKSITIPDSVIFIADNAFLNCTNLESISIPKSVEKLYGGSFYGCSSLKTVEVDPENPIYCSIDGNVYSKDQKTLILYAPGKEQVEFEIPKGVIGIGKEAFARCDFLEQIIIPATVTEIPYDSIWCCESLRGVAVDESNQNYQAIDGNLYSKDGTTFLRFCKSEKNASCSIPSGVTTIGEYAAYGMGNLTAITIPDTVTSIGPYAMNGTGLRSVHIPGSVIYIGECAFSGCENLTEAFFEDTADGKVIPVGGKFASAKEIDREAMESSETNAKYLVKTYETYEWHSGN